MKRGNVREKAEGLTTVLSVMAHNGRLPFPISSPACNRADATSVDRISSPVFPWFPYFSASCRSPLCPFPLMFLSLSAATTVTGDYGKATRRDRDNGCVVCVRGKDRRKVESDGTKREGYRGRGERSWVVWRVERESFSQSDSTQPALLSRHANSTAG